MPNPACNLALTEQERAALSIALRTLLLGWGESENLSQKRLHTRLRAISTKLEALSPVATHTVTSGRRERQPLSH